MLTFGPGGGGGGFVGLFYLYSDASRLEGIKSLPNLIPFNPPLTEYAIMGNLLMWLLAPIFI
jgi:hypothetical protein